MKNVLLFLFTTLSTILSGQPANDNCSDAIEIVDVTNYCSDFGAFNNQGATNSLPVINGLCLPNMLSAKDVWFKFTATANFARISVNGASPINPNGTIKSPQVIVFSGSCTNLTKMICHSDAFQENKLEVYAGPLTPGQNYFINVSGRDDVTGTFQLCLDNYEQVFEADGDCASSRILCDKSSVFVSNFVGIGDDKNEIDINSCIGSEFASSWYRWTCSKSGTLIIKLTPLLASDDLDYALFELPGGVDDCRNKKMIRCGAAGEIQGRPISDWIQCTGPTGLNFESSDLIELAGCNDGNDSWVKYVDMVEGRSYSFIVNNFSPTGQGFTMEFGGTGEFLGARADFDFDPVPVCFEDSLSFINLSIQPTDPIVKWDWEFGNNANPPTSSDKNPGKILYDRPGYKSATLTITSLEGCINTIHKTFIAKCCDSPLEVALRAVPTAEVKLGDYIDLEAITTNAVGNTTFEWIPADLLIDCFSCGEVTVRPVKDGTFYVVAQDEKGCITQDSLEIRVIDNAEVFAPNVFSPNYDGNNDNFTIFPNQGAKSIRFLRVYNRWGACVYEGVDLLPGDDTMGWDGTFKGKECNPDVFAYYAEVEFLNDRVQLIKGSITLVR